jgi:hypothetical protein
LSSYYSEYLSYVSLLSSASHPHSTQSNSTFNKHKGGSNDPFPSLSLTYDIFNIHTHPSVIYLLIPPTLLLLTTPSILIFPTTSAAISRPSSARLGISRVRLLVLIRYLQLVET